MSVLPTLCTLGNLVCGFAAIPYASMPVEFTGPWGWSGLTCAGALIFVGMLLDAVDGWIARVTNSTSELGGQLDSLADVVTFGVAPAYMMLRLVTTDVGLPFIGPEADDVLAKIVWAVAVVYVCCAALRLARFNVETGATVERSDSFRGLPSPGAAGAVASLILLHQDVLYGGFGEQMLPILALGLPFVTLLAAFAMVSGIPYAHVTNRYLSGSRSFTYVARMVVVIGLVMWFPQGTLAVLFTTYLVAGPLSGLRQGRAAS